MITLSDALRSTEFGITAELSLTPQMSAAEVVDQAKMLASNADAVQIPDHRNARPHMSGITVASLLLPEGIDTVLRVNCRDANRIAIQSELLAARSLGLRNLLLLRGAKLPDDHQPRSTEVHDLTAIDLLRTAAAIRDGEVFVGGDFEDNPPFFLGAVATAFDPTPDWQPEKLLAKADAGAQFVQLQLCMNTDTLSNYVARLVETRMTWRFQVLATIAVLPSAEAARELRHFQPDSVIPSSIVSRLERAQDPVDEGIDIAAEALRTVLDIPGISGANLVTPGAPESISAAIERSGIRDSR